MTTATISPNLPGIAAGNVVVIWRGSAGFFPGGATRTNAASEGALHSTAPSTCGSGAGATLLSTFDVHSGNDGVGAWPGPGTNARPGTGVTSIGARNASFAAAFDMARADAHTHTHRHTMQSQNQELVV